MEQQNPVIGDRVQHNNGYLAEVIGLGQHGDPPGIGCALHNIKFLEGPFASVNCLRQEFTFLVRD